MYYFKHLLQYIRISFVYLFSFLLVLCIIPYRVYKQDKIFLLFHWSFGYQFKLLDFANRKKLTNTIFWLEQKRGNKYLGVIFPNLKIVRINSVFFSKIIPAKILFNAIIEVDKFLKLNIFRNLYDEIFDYNEKYSITTNTGRKIPATLGKYINLLKNNVRPSLPLEQKNYIEEKFLISKNNTIALVHHRTARSLQASDLIRSSSASDTAIISNKLSNQYDHVFIMSDEKLNYCFPTNCILSWDLNKKDKDLSTIYFQLYCHFYFGPHSGALLPSSSCGAQICIWNWCPFDYGGYNYDTLLVPVKIIYKKQRIYLSKYLNLNGLDFESHQHDVNFEFIKNDIEEIDKILSFNEIGNEISDVVPGNIPSSDSFGRVFEIGE